MPFIIKASYEGNTRRWTQQSDVFPTYQSLSDQIHKIFKNVDNFYLTRVTFSPSAGDQQPTPSQFVLIANTVNSGDEWTSTAAAPFLGVSYPTGMLKFIVNDKLSHKEAPNRGGPWANSMDVDVEPRFSVPPFPFPRPLPRGYSVPMAPLLPSMPSGMQPLPTMPSGMRPLPSTSMFPPPMSGPPPFIPFIPPPGSTGVPLPPPSAPSLRTMRSDLSTSTSTSTCCSVDTAKTEVKGMMDSFLKDFQKTIADNFGAENGGDAMDTSSPIQPDRTPLAPNRPLSPVGNIPGAFNAPSSPAEPVIHPSVICDLCNSMVKGIRYRCNECPDFDICETCMGENNNGAVIHNVQIDKTHTFKAIPKPVSPGPTPLPTHNASCDVCRKTIIGSRHKCLDCPDYDLCDKCFASQRDKHDNGHEFYEFKEPGRIVIHNVTRPFPRPHHRGPPFGHHHHHGGPFGGRGRGGRGGFAGRPHHVRPTSEESSSATGALNRDAPDVTVPPVGTRPQLVAHNATCDLCDSKIFGSRYKCGMCPDYDVCESCFSIVVEQHPKHPFVRIRDPKDVMVRSHHYANRTSHHARCDSCGKQIVGARFKCTHRDCPDFDLCENCEALPIEAHPSSHALIKLRHPIAFYEGLAGVLEYAKATKQKQTEMMDSARTQGATPEPSVSIWQPTVIRHVAEQGATLNDMPSPQVPSVIRIAEQGTPIFVPSAFIPPSVVRPRTPTPLRVPEEKVEQSLPSASDPFYMEPIVQESNDAVVLEAEGERVQMPLPTRPRPSPVVVPAPDGKLIELTRAMSIKTESSAPSMVSTPSTVKSSLADEEDEVASVVLVAEAEMEVSVPPSEDSASPFGDAHAVQDKIEDDAASIISAAPSVISLASTHSSIRSAPRPSATFVTDITIPDGHILPPGAFFVKSWKMLNDGEIPWPAGTHLAFTGGERFGTGSGNAEQPPVAGLTPPQEMTEIRVEFRAPEVPGKYVSYWRLQDEEGRLFGHRIWCAVEVVEQRAEDANLKTKSSESSLASSSIMIMPASVASEASASPVASPIQEAMPTPTLSSFDGDASDLDSHVSDVADDDVFSVADSDFQWEDASRPQSPDQFVMVYESSNDASDSDD